MYGYLGSHPALWNAVLDFMYRHYTAFINSKVVKLEIGCIFLLRSVLKCLSSALESVGMKMSAVAGTPVPDSMSQAGRKATW